MSETRGQRRVFAVLLAINVVLVFLSFATGLQEQALLEQGMSTTLPDVPAWVLGLANAAIVFVLYGLLGLAGLWFARKLGLPGMYREGAGWREWFVAPMIIGALAGIVLVVADRLFAAARGWDGCVHPPFPLSLIASAAAGVGEEIIFRLFVMGLWAWLLNLILKRWQATKISLWIGNVVAALAFAAGHLPSAMLLLGLSSLAEIPSLVLAELFLLNGLVGLVAGERYMRDGFVAAAGVHFWADIVWHVVWPLVGGV